jgi:lipopolysaccharide export system permease protein
MHILVPLSSTRLNERQAEIAQNITSRILTEGQFIEPTDGITVYIRDITPEGELRDVFLSDLRDPESQVTYTARRAYLVRNDGDAQLVMVDGMAQSMRTADQRLFVTEFADFSYNIGNLMNITPRTNRNSREVMTWDLLDPTAALEAETGRTAAQLVTEAHDRISQSVLGAVAALLGFSALMIGSFSRFGAWPQVIFAVVLIIVIKSLETTGLNIARSAPQMWFASYLAVVSGLVMVAALLFVGSRPYLLKRKPARGATA